MSRRRSTSSVMGPPPDRDVVMGPPPVPAPSSSSTPKTKDTQEITEKYRKLKRRYFELEEKHKETSTELQRSGERNVKMREERNLLLERIMELESQPENKSNGASSSSPSPPTVTPAYQPSSSAFPRSLLNPRTRTSFAANLRQAAAEDDGDEDVDPLLTSRHVGPLARKRAEEERKERVEEEVKETRKPSTRKGRSGKGKEAATGGTSSSHAPSEQPVLVSSGGMRLRIKPPAPPAPGSPSEAPKESTQSPPSQALSSTHPHPHSYTHPPPPPPANFQEGGHSSSGSPVTPMMIDLPDNEPQSPVGGDEGRLSSPQPSNHGRSTPTPASSHSPTYPLRDEGHSEHGTPTTDHIDGPGPAMDVDDEGVSKIGLPTPAKLDDALSVDVARVSPAPTAENSNMATSTTDPPVTPKPASVSPAPAPTPTTETATSASSISEALTPVSASNDNGSISKDLTPPIRDEDIDPSLMAADSRSARSAALPVKDESPKGNENTGAASSTAIPAPAASASGTAQVSPVSGSAPSFPTVTTPTVGLPPMALLYPRIHGGPETQAYLYPYPFPYAHLTPGAPGIMSPSLYTPPTHFTPPSAQRPPSEVQRQAKPKRLKAHTVTSKSFSIPMVPRDKKGKPMLPLNVGIMTVICLGDVCMREHFHTERYIFPVGYEVTRRYLSTVDPAIEVVYHCTILDGGDGPKFQIVPSDTPDRPVIAGTATGAWSSIVKQANAIRNRQHSNSVSGPDFFGLGQNTIKHLIQELPNADRLRDYVWQKFVEGGPLGGRHAAVIPALPEEYDASMPIGAYYPNERERELARLKREATDAPFTPGPSTSHYQSHTHQAVRPQPQKRQNSSPQQQEQTPQSQSQSQPQNQHSSQAQSQHSLQPGVTQIVLPPPTTSETLNIQEYQPPANKRATRATAGGSHAASPAPSRGQRKTSRSPSMRGEQQQQQIPTHGHHTRSSSRSQPVTPQSQALHSPYLANATTSASPPTVPPTFATIMNAYPAPTASPQPSSAGGNGGSE